MKSSYAVSDVHSLALESCFDGELFTSASRPKYSIPMHKTSSRPDDGQLLHPTKLTKYCRVTIIYDGLKLNSNDNDDDDDNDDDNDDDDDDDDDDNSVV